MIYETTLPIFCSFCGSHPLIGNNEETSFSCSNCGRTAYLNSKPSACGIAIVNDQVLLISESTSEPPQWDLPGGFLRYGESPEDGLRRELREELNADITVGDLLIILIDTYGQYHEYTLNIFYMITILPDTMVPGSEVRQFKWFDLKHLPVLKYKSTGNVLSKIDIFREKDLKNG